MTEKHLIKGSEFPKRTNNKVRLFSGEYCAFAIRVRTVLALKNIPYEIVNVNTINKPEWLTEINPKGQIPVLDTGSLFLPESLAICEYLDEVYPEPPLHSADQQERNGDVELLKVFDDLLSILDAGVRSKDESTYSGFSQRLVEFGPKFEDELKKRGTYFGGTHPRMVDFMIWPFAERASVLERLFNTKFPDATVFPHLYRWCAIMRKHPTLEGNQLDLEKLYKLYVMYRSGNPEDSEIDI
ncbi:hypothetical protein RI129_010776 [Pyrocoelia pectoralis]|uniref:Glutathione S-transferase omega-1 n=1 Tax=Pyrocoelia pectoralis TaxID=417401 RepID=A0AAN7Z931_9COLE